MYGVIIAVSCILGALVWGLYGGKRRRDATPPEVKKLGLQFKRERNYRIGDQFPFLNDDQKNSNCYAFNTMSGSYQGHEIVAFDYHYETARAGTHLSSFFILMLPAKSTLSETALADIQKLHSDTNIELSQDQLALRFNDDLKTEKLEPRLKKLIGIYDLILNQ